MAGLRIARKASSYLALGTLGLLASLAFVACGSDGASAGSNEEVGGAGGQASPDTSMAGTPADEVAVASCAEVEDGEACEDGLCLGGECAPSRCGDGYVDAAQDEQCEDGNDETGDGCSLCRFDCSADAACDDGEACNGAESCNSKSHQCQAGTAIDDQSECEMADAMAGACRNGACVPAGCGNSTVDAGEDCDDGNVDDADGCTATCAFTCSVDADCDNANKCDGAEACDAETHTCKAGTPVSCRTAACMGECSPELGECVFPDGDKDGSGCNVDCNDDDADRRPGAFECQDGKDNDCSADTGDKGAPSCECYVDGDQDGFAVSTASSVASTGDCPKGYTRTFPGDTATTDCGAKVAAAHPGQKEFFPTAYCPGPLLCKVGTGSFDYNCDGAETSSFTDGRVAAASCAGASGVAVCQLRSGWVGKVPVCGAEGIYRACSWVKEACVGTDVPDRVRPCH